MLQFFKEASSHLNIYMPPQGCRTNFFGKSQNIAPFASNGRPHLFPPGEERTSPAVGDIYGAIII